MSFVLGSENRKTVVKTLFQYPQRQWSCSAVEEVTKLSHATVFRTLQGLVRLGLLRCFKINKKDFLYSLVKDSILKKELEDLLSIETRTARKAAQHFVERIREKRIMSIVLYGSAAAGSMKPGSDIDILVIINKHDGVLETKIQDIAADLSVKFNVTLAVTIMTKREMQQERKSQFLTSVQHNHEVLHGKAPF